MPETLGYKTKGASSWNIGKFFACRHVCPKNGILNSISVYLFNDSGSTQKIQLGIYNDVSGTLGKRLISTISVSIPNGFNAWRTIVLTAFLNLGSAYWLTLQLENSAAIVYVYYDAGDEEQQAYKEDWDFGTWPDNPVGLSYYANKLSIYATYTLVPVSPYNWGLLSKNQIDPERIESAVDRIVSEHNDNEEAHVGAGRSLDQHKLSEVIDHVISSIIADKIKNGIVGVRKFSSDKIFYITNFESLDSWAERSGFFALSTIGIALYTTNVINNITYMMGNAIGAYRLLQMSKNPIFQATVSFVSITNQVAYFKLGDNEGDDYDDGFGFKVVNGTLYALHVRTVDDYPVEYTTQITGITLTSWNIYRAEYNSEVPEIRFYVNGVLRAIHTENLPLDPPTDVWCSFYIKTTEAAIKWLRLLDLLFQVDG